MALSDKMRATLEALEEWSGGIDAGTTAGEVIASGGTRSCLRRAVKLGWARQYGSNARSQGFYSTEMGNVPRYLRTDEGTKVLSEGS